MTAIKHSDHARSPKAPGLLLLASLAALSGALSTAAGHGRRSHEAHRGADGGWSGDSFAMELLVYPAVYYLWKRRSLPALAI